MLFEHTYSPLYVLFVYKVIVTIFLIIEIYFFMTHMQIYVINR